MLSFTNLALRRGPNLLFEDASFVIHRDKKVGLIGSNGAGKTSLFKMITGELEVEEGYLDYPHDLRISYLAQEVAETDEVAVQYVLEGDKQLIEIQQKIRSAEENERFDELGELHAIFNSMDGHAALSKAEQLMIGLGFSQEDLKKTVKDFSGGWRVRLNLARTLMQPSDLLLLDEPTNHLDLDAIVWLADWIKSFKGALILISHDREFLDECVNTIAHIHRQAIELYTGNYSQFEEVKALRLAEQAATFKKQQREIAHMQDFVRRFKAKATKARQAQSRVKALERMEVIAPAHVDSPFHFSIPQAEKISDPLLTLDEATLGYSEPVLQKINLSLHPGDRIGLLGPNGAGKSTLMKSLVGAISLLDGHKFEGGNLKVGYFSQHQVDDLDLSKTAYQYIHQLDTDKTEQQVRTYLGGYDFKNDKVKDPIKLFSGGEKARLALAIIAYQKPNLLLMDEPTNHLDMEMRQALTMALQSFGGAILLISHDRHLLANNVDKFLLVEDGSLNEFDGDLHDYSLRILKNLNKPQQGKSKKKDRPTEGANKKAEQKIIRQLKAEIMSAEKRLKRLQGKITDVEAVLQSPDTYDGDFQEDLHDLIRNQSELKSEIEEVEQVWLNLSEQLEAAS
ncbi:ABC transporter, ATP-binding protein [SAR86 cluster bacterium SAR86E]|uniref:Probable ATP-binding protein YheS n=1 Tax=SAR86 cluster bacterium SAR86E TaxID=1208365 RepID=K6H481_9GAMM|nr:ABC transporter, ATP-binding protein [SAR86 cluster bacterium SAR86E]